MRSLFYPSELNPNGQVTAEQFTVLEQLGPVLASEGTYHSSSLPTASLDVLSLLLGLWEPEKLFPALDIARKSVLHPDGKPRVRAWDWKVLDGRRSNSLRLTSGARYWTRTDKQPPPLLSIFGHLDLPHAINKRLAWQFLANTFRHPAGGAAVGKNLAYVLRAIASIGPDQPKETRLAAATVFLNLATASTVSPMLDVPTLDSQAQHLATEEDEETLVRLLVGFGKTGDRAREAV